MTIQTVAVKLADGKNASLMYDNKGDRSGSFVVHELDINKWFEFRSVDPEEVFEWDGVVYNRGLRKLDRHIAAGQRLSAFRHWLGKRYPANFAELLSCWPKFEEYEETYLLRLYSTFTSGADGDYIDVDDGDWGVFPAQWVLDNLYLSLARQDSAHGGETGTPLQHFLPPSYREAANS